MRFLPRPLTLWCLFALAPALSAQSLEVHVIRVGNAGSGLGQGLAVFVRGPDGTRVLVDGGNAGDGSGVVRPYLLSLGVTGLDTTFMTHWHTDHMGGMDELFTSGFLPAEAYDRGDFMRPSNTQVTQYLSAVGNRRAIPPLGLTVPLGGGATIQVEALNGATQGGSVNLSGGENQFENASSLVLVVRYGDFECYIGGDVTSGGNSTPDVESLAAADIGQVEVVVASHHGSRTSSDSGVVADLDPSLVVFSCGRDNPFGHPDDLVVANWSNPLGTRVLWCTTEGDTQSAQQSGGFTGLDGTIVIRTDGRTFTAGRAGAAEELGFTTFENPGFPPLPGGLVVSEVLVNPGASSDSFGEWFELVNVSAAPRDLGGMVFRSGTQSFLLRSRILLEQNEPLIVGVDGKRSRNGDVFVDFSPPFGSFSLSNATSSLVLEAPGGGQLETVAWGSGGFPVQSGASRERIDLYGGAASANFAPASAPWSGADLGSPREPNAADTTHWLPGLWTPDPKIGGTAEFHLTAYSDPFAVYVLAGSRGLLLPGFPVFGFQIPLQPDSLFFTLLTTPGFVGNLDPAGTRLVTLGVPNSPSLVGVNVYSNFITLDFAGGGFVGDAQSNLSTQTIGQ